MHSLSHCILRALLLPAAAVLMLAPALSQEQPACASIQTADGACADAELVGMANRRSAIVSSQFTSYFGTPMGTVGQPFIPHERLFRDDPIVFGLPTNEETVLTFPSSPPVPPGDPFNTQTTRSK